MINVLFFARIREQLGVDKLSLSLEEAGPTIADLRASLVADKDAKWQEVLGADNVITAVNQAVVDHQHALSDGDEVAFFPPVTGG